MSDKAASLQMLFIGLLIVALAVIACRLVAIHWFPEARFVLWTIACVGALGGLLLLLNRGLTTAAPETRRLSGFGLLVAALMSWIALPASASEHPMFETPLSGQSGWRPAIQVDIIDDTEWWLGIPTHAELYLSIQSSRMPGNAQTVFPLGMGASAGCRSQFIQVPFEVRPGDVLTLNLWDDDALSAREKELVRGSLETVGYFVIVGSYYYFPALDSLHDLIQPGFADATEIASEMYFIQREEHPFSNVGTAEYIVQPSRPSQPSDANVLTVKKDNRARIEVKFYFPEHRLD